jgi:uncharacterized protein involved in outer membrane biogenesis
MRRIGRWLLLTFVLTCVLLSVALFLLVRWVGTDDFRSRVQAQASEVAGREVRLGEVTVDVWPLPAVVLNRVELATQPAIHIARIEVRPVLPALFSGRLELSTLLVRQADLSQAAVDDLRAAQRSSRKPQAGQAQPPGAVTDVVQVIVPRRVVLDSATWRSGNGSATMFNADARLDLQALPDELNLTVLAGSLQGTRLAVQRISSKAEWDLDLEIAGGTVKGRLQLPQLPGPGLELTGQFETRNVELGVLLRAQQLEQGAGGSDPRAAMGGKLEASTTFRARAADWGGLREGLQTESRFVVHQAVIHGIDLVKAVRSVGLSRGGVTRLDTLAGQVRTRGRTVELRNLVASSGALSAGGQVTIAPDRQLQGRIEVNLGAKMVGTAVGVPLLVEGTLDKPQLRLTRAALAGAAIGTLIMPGVGTGAGATLGDKISNGLKGLFGK